MDLGDARIARTGINTLHDAMHPIYGLAWTNGQNVFIVPMSSDHGDIEFASSVKLGTFHLVRGVNWCRNHSLLNANGLLCIVLESNVMVWTVEGLCPNVCFEQISVTGLNVVAKCCIWNPVVDILCVLSAMGCHLYVHHLKKTLVPLALPLSNKRSVSCGSWSPNGCILVICAAANLLVYRWVDINACPDDFIVGDCSLLPRLAGDLRCIEFFSEEQFVCLTELPLDQLCIQETCDMFSLPDARALSDGDHMTYTSDDSDGFIRQNLGTKPSLLDQLFCLPRVNKDSRVDSAHLYLMHVDPNSLEVKSLSNVFISGLLSPDVMSVCHCSGSVFVGSNASNVVSRFKIIDSHLTKDGHMKLLEGERLKGLCLLSSLKQRNLEGSLVMMAGHISVQDSLFPPTSDFTHYHLRLYHVKDLTSLFKSPSVKNRGSSKRDVTSVGDQKFPSCSVKQFDVSKDSLHADANQIADALSTNINSPEIIRRIYADKQKPNRYETMGTDTDLFRIDRLCLPGSDFGFAKRPFVEVIQEEPSERDGELETEVVDFESVVPRFNTTDPSKVFSNASVLRENFEQREVTNESLASLLKSCKRLIGQESATSSDVSDSGASDNTGVILKTPSVVQGGSKFCDCHDRQTTDILSQLNDLNLKLKSQEAMLTKVLSTVEGMQWRNSSSSHQPSSNPLLVLVVFQDSSDIRVKLSKSFLLDNLRLKLNSVLGAFDLASVEIIFDGKPCVVSADVDGYIPLIFTPNETIFITGHRRDGKNRNYPTLVS